MTSVAVSPKLPAEAPEPSAVDHPLLYAEHEISAPVESAWDQLKTDFKASMPDKTKWQHEGMWDQMKDQFRANVAAGKVPIDAFNLVTAPISGAVHGAVIQPAAKGMTYGLNEIIPGYMNEPAAENLISSSMMALGPEGKGIGGALGKESPMATALKTSKAAPKTLPTPSGPYAEAVKQLQSEGVDLTLGQTHGGVVRRAEEAHKSNPLTGTAIREAENKSIQTFNRATYNRVLAPIGEKFTGDEIGRAGVKQIGDKISAAYDRIKPKLTLTPDDQFLTDMAEIRSGASEMPDTQEKQFETILNNRLLKRVGPDGKIDGSTFKQVESELTHLSSVYKSSGDAAHRELGGAIGDVVTALRENLERSSDPSVREELKKINTSWAMLTRLEGAASRRATTGGVFTTGDLLAAVKSGDRSARKRTFARGDALLQDFAETAHTVLPNRLPDSGTAEREQWNNLTGIILRGAGVATNPLYKRAAEAMKKTYAEP